MFFKLSDKKLSLSLNIPLLITDHKQFHYALKKTYLPVCMLDLYLLFLFFNFLMWNKIVLFLLYIVFYFIIIIIYLITIYLYL